MADSKFPQAGWLGAVLKRSGRRLMAKASETKGKTLKERLASLRGSSEARKDA
jgi:hypothetical protein